MYYFIYKGCFVPEHHTLPGIKSHMTVPDGLNVKFSLELLWSEQTFDGPIQFWKATSNYNLKVINQFLKDIIFFFFCTLNHLFKISKIFLKLFLSNRITVENMKCI